MEKPILNKKPIEGKNKIFRYGINRVQGWKKEMEIYNLNDNNIGPQKDINIFGIFDGHSGNEISQYLSINFTKLLLENENFKNGNYSQALIDIFKNIDISLKTEEVNDKLVFYRKQNRIEKKEKMNNLFKSDDNKDNLNKNDIDDLNILMDMIDPNNLEGVFIADFVGSSGIVILINDKMTYIANAGNSHCIAINKRLSIINDKNDAKQILNTNKEKTRINISQGIKYGKEKEKTIEDEEFLYTRGFGDFQYKNNILLNLEEQEISSEPDIVEIPNEEIQFLIICNHGFYEYGKQIIYGNNFDNNNDINFDKIIADYFIKNLTNNQKKISEIIGEYFDIFIPKDNNNNQYYNTENLSCIIIDFVNN